MSRPVILMPDPLNPVIRYLQAFLDGLDPVTYPYASNVTVGARLLDTPARYIMVRRIGGLTNGPVLDNPRLDFMVWHDGTAGDRVKLANIARAGLLAMNGTYSGVQVYAASEFLGPTDLPDPRDETKTVSMFTHQFVMRGTQLPAS